MITNIQTLQSDEQLRQLLDRYVQLHKSQPKVEWHDRVMELDGCDTQRLAKLHGLLLASGWIETRVHGDSFRHAGRLEACYKVTHDGVHALRLAAMQHPIDETPIESEDA